MARHEFTEKDGTHVCKCGVEVSTLNKVRKHLEPGSSISGSKGSRYYKRHNGSKWELNRILAKIRAGFECEICGLTNQEHKEREDLFGKGLHVHHRVPIKKFKDPKEGHELWNLQVLCSNCHFEKEKN